MAVLATAAISGRIHSPMVRVFCMGGRDCVNYVRLPFNKWWPLPSHEPVPEARSKFSFLKIATVTVSFCSAGSTTQPDHKTVWPESWDVPLSDRLEKSGVHLKSRDDLAG